MVFAYFCIFSHRVPFPRGLFFIHKLHCFEIKLVSEDEQQQEGHTPAPLPRAPGHSRRSRITRELRNVGAERAAGRVLEHFEVEIPALSFPRSLAQNPQLPRRARRQTRRAPSLPPASASSAEGSLPSCCLALKTLPSSELQFAFLMNHGRCGVNSSWALLHAARGEAKAPRPAEPLRRSRAGGQASPALCQAADSSTSSVSRSLVTLFPVEMPFALARWPSSRQWDAQLAGSKGTGQGCGALQKGKVMGQLKQGLHVFG